MIDVLLCSLCRWLHLLDGLASADCWTCWQVDWQTAFYHCWSAAWCNGSDCCQHVRTYRSPHASVCCGPQTNSKTTTLSSFIFQKWNKHT